MNQHAISLRISLAEMAQLMESFGDSVRDRARLGCAALQHTGDWLNTAPLRALGLWLRPREFRMAARYRLGLPVFAKAGPCPASRCKMNCDVMGDHAIACGSDGERIARHDYIHNVLYEAAASAALSPRR